MYKICILISTFLLISTVQSKSSKKGVVTNKVYCGDFIQQSYENVDSCTPENNDPWAGGSYVECCSENLKSCLKNWNGGSNYFYLCKPCSDSECAQSGPCQQNGPTPEPSGASGLTDVTWFYDWNYNGYSAQCNDLGGAEYVPQIWGGNFDENTIKNNAWVRKANYILTFNEPDMTSQSNMQASTAAAVWSKVVNIARANNLQIVAPCMATYSDNLGRKWMRDWDNYCKAYYGSSCEFEYTCLHTYAYPNNYDWAKNEVNLMASDWGKKVWLTEFACPTWENCPVSSQTQLVQGYVPWLESNSNVFRYSWFLGRSGGPSALFNSGQQNGLTAVGKAYGADYSMTEGMQNSTTVHIGSKRTKH